jgi:hypothetical protein
MRYNIAGNDRALMVGRMWRSLITDKLQKSVYISSHPPTVETQRPPGEKKRVPVTAHAKQEINALTLQTDSNVKETGLN